jgi:hypothetical protein
MTALVGTIAGCVAVAGTYLSWPHRPEEEASNIIMFDSSKVSIKVRLGFVASLVALIAYAAAPAGAVLPLILNAIAMYFFFYALVTATLAAREVDRQRTRWEALDPSQRQAWIDHRAEQDKINLKLHELAEESRSTVEEARRVVEQSRRDLRAWKNEDQRRRRQDLVQRFYKPLKLTYRWSIKMRRRVGRGERFLTQRERTNLKLEAIEGETLLDELRLKRTREAFERIQAKTLHKFRDEQTGLEFFRDGVLQYLLIETELDEKEAQNLIARLATGGVEADTKLENVTVFMDGDLAITDQARALLVERKIKFFWPAEWSKAGAPTSASG